MYLALQRNRIANISEIAERYDISRNHLVKVVHNLARGGFIKTYRGKGGGIELARGPGDRRGMRQFLGDARSVHLGRSRQTPQSPEQSTGAASGPQLNRSSKPPGAIVFEGRRTREGRFRR